MRTAGFLTHLFNRVCLLSLNGNELPLAPPTFIQPWQQLSSDRGMAAGQQTAVKPCTDPEQD